MNVAEWKQARQWLINSGVIPVTHPVTKPTVDLVDFARSLRDGVFLCNLLLKLKPGCVENFNSRPIAQVCYCCAHYTFTFHCQFCTFVSQILYSVIKLLNLITFNDLHGHQR